MELKQGTKTSEAWLSAAAVALLALAPKFGYPISPETQAQMIAAVAAVYTAGRSFVKGAASRAK